MASQKPGDGKPGKGKRAGEGVSALGQTTPQRHFSEKGERSVLVEKGTKATKAFKRPWISILL